MKRWFSVICILMITVLTVGCGKNSFQPSVSSIYVHKDGRITEAIVESFIQDYYSFDEFQSMVEKEVAAYDNVSIKSLELKDSTVYLLLVLQMQKLTANTARYTASSERWKKLFQQGCRLPWILKMSSMRSTARRK